MIRASDLREPIEPYGRAHLVGYTPKTRTEVGRQERSNVHRPKTRTTTARPAGPFHGSLPRGLRGRPWLMAVRAKVDQRRQGAEMVRTPGGWQVMRLHVCGPARLAVAL